MAPSHQNSTQLFQIEWHELDSLYLLPWFADEIYTINNEASLPSKVPEILTACKLHDTC